MVTINSFSSLLELAAGLNIAFVAVEYTKSYTQTLSLKVFKFGDLINQSFKDCDSTLHEKETLKNLGPSEINGKSTLPEIEKNKRELELLETTIKQTKEKLTNKIHFLCESKSFSSLSLWNFLFAISVLFLSGFESSIETQYFLYTLSFITLIFMIIGWIKGEKQPKILRFMDYASLKHIIVAFAISLIFSLTISLVTIYLFKSSSNNSHIFQLKNFIIPICVIIPFVNFIAFLCIVRRKVSIIKKEIANEAKELLPKCAQLKKTIESLVAVNNVRDLLTTS